MSLRTDEHVVRIKVVTPHALVSSGIQALVEGTHGSLTVSARGQAGPAEVVFYDAIGLDQGADPALEALLAQRDSSVVAVVPFSRPDLAVVACRYGAQATIAMGASQEEFLAVIRAAAIDDLASYAASAPGTLARQVRRGGLTRREAEVLTLIVAGHTNAYIAESLSVSINSVKSYIRSAYRRMDVVSRSQAVAWGVLHGFVDGISAPDPGR